MINSKLIYEKLNSQLIGKKIVCLDAVDSTNNYAKRNIADDNGAVFISEIQTSGRGRHGNIWVSDNDGGLWMSILLKPCIDAEKMSAFTLVTGLAAVKALRRLTNADVLIKWPNDIVLNKKKLGGILCEMVTGKNSVNLIAGIGINIMNFPKGVACDACSVAGETGIKLTRESLAAEIIGSIEPLYFEFIKNGFGSVLPEYKKYCVTVGHEVLIKFEGEYKKGLAIDVNNLGELVVNINGDIKNVASGEVSVRGLFGYV